MYRAEFCFPDENIALIQKMDYRVLGIFPHCVCLQRIFCCWCWVQSLWFAEKSTNRNYMNLRSCTKASRGKSICMNWDSSTLILFSSVIMSFSAYILCCYIFNSLWKTKLAWHAYIIQFLSRSVFEKLTDIWSYCLSSLFLSNSRSLEKWITKWKFLLHFLKKKIVMHRVFILSNISVS